MNISENIARIKQGKDDIIKSLQNKGVSINENTLISEIPIIIDNAEIGGGGDTPIQPDIPELIQKYEGASVFRINVPTDNYEFAINLCNDATKATYDVDWGDGVLESGLTTNEQHHTYSKSGIYDVNVYNISKNITLGGTSSIGCFTSGTNQYYTYTQIVYLFNNTNNDINQLIYKEFKDNICTNIFIGDKITTINSSAFSGCSSLQSIELPSTLTTINSSAFSGCSSLQSIIIPETVTSIQDYVFSGCYSLQSIVIPEGVKTIKDYAFQNCSSLQNIELPSTLTTINGNAFSGCSSLQNIVIPEGVTTINQSTFSGCSSLQNIELPSTLTTINQSTFSGCSSLQSIVIPEGVTTINQSAFSGCSSLQSIVIPEGVTTINQSTFSGCSSLQSIVIPEGVTTIGSYAFQNCSSLQSIVIPEGVTTINNYTFQNCSSLQNIVIPEGVTTIGSYAFQNCSSLQNIVIPEGVTTINGNAFSGCSSLQNIVIPEGVTTIGSYAFEKCSSLQNIELPSTLKSISNSVFSGVYYLQKIVSKAITAPTISGSLFPSSYSEFSKTYLYISKDSVGYDSGNWKTSVIQIIYLEDYKKTPTDLKLKTKNNKLINLPYIGQAKLIDYELIDNEYIYHFDDKITQIPRGFFTNNPILQSIIIPEGVTAFGTYSYGGSGSFSGCSSLQYVELPSTLKSITKNAFQNCSSLQSIIIPETVTSIQDYVFSGCYSLQSIICKAMTAPTINGSSAFVNIGTSVPSGTPKILRVPDSAVGYDEGYWKTYVIDKGYTLEYVPLSEL